MEEINRIMDDLGLRDLDISPLSERLIGKLETIEVTEAED